MRLSVLRKKGGQAVVEMTFGFLLFFTIFMSIVEFSHLLYAKVTLQHALRSAGRYMVTGQTKKDGDGNDIPRDQMVHTVFCANVIAAGVVCPSLGSDFQFVCLPTPGTDCTRPGGGPNQTVMVTVNLAKPALMPFFSQFYPTGGVPFTLSTTWKNEPFA
ncbi:MAG: pilus assembly protein [Deltaproteobacteria bacterium]|nr:pilus assembly protein [Deltaproteobacteria bacterium]